MNATNPVIEARRTAYRTISWILLAVDLLLIVLLVGGTMFILPRFLKISADMGQTLPMATQVLLRMRTFIFPLAAGLLAVALIVKEILAPPLVRFLLNLAALLLVLLAGAIGVFLVFLPLFSMLQAS